MTNIFLPAFDVSTTCSSSRDHSSRDSGPFSLILQIFFPMTSRVPPAILGRCGLHFNLRMSVCSCLFNNSQFIYCTRYSCSSHISALLTHLRSALTLLDSLSLCGGCLTYIRFDSHIVLSHLYVSIFHS